MGELPMGSFYMGAPQIWARGSEFTSQRLVVAFTGSLGLASEELLCSSGG